MARGKRKNTMDYTTAAFRFWARHGCPSYEEARARIYNSALQRSGVTDPVGMAEFAENEVARSSAELGDILACDQVFRELAKQGDGVVCDAVRAVYMAQPGKKLRATDITNRVLAFTLSAAVSERQVYRYLARARRGFAVARGLRMDEDETEW